jgi:hypothetical protein
MRVQDEFPAGGIPTMETFVIICETLLKCQDVGAQFLAMSKDKNVGYVIPDAWATNRSNMAGGVFKKPATDAEVNTWVQDPAKFEHQLREHMQQGGASWFPGVENFKNDLNFSRSLVANPRMNVLEQAVLMGLWPIAGYLTPYGISANYRKIGLELRRRSGHKLIERASQGLLYMDGDNIDMGVKHCGASSKRGVTPAVMKQRLERDFEKMEAWLGQAEKQMVAKRPQVDQLYAEAATAQPAKAGSANAMQQAMMQKGMMNQTAAHQAFAQMMQMRGPGAPSSAPPISPAAPAEPTKKEAKQAAKKAEKAKKK